MKVIEVKQQVGKKSGAPYWNVKLDDGTYANAFEPVNIGQEGQVTQTTKGDKTYRNFVPVVSAPIEQQGSHASITSGVPASSSEIQEILDLVRKIYLEVVPQDEEKL